MERLARMIVNKATQVRAERNAGMHDQTKINDVWVRINKYQTGFIFSLNNISIYLDFDTTGVAGDYDLLEIASNMLTVDEVREELLTAMELDIKDLLTILL